jgi:twinkle protein
VAAAEPYPLEGVHRPSAEAMIAYRKRPPPAVMTTGCSRMDAVVALPTEGKLIVITGIPSHGKSTLVRHLMCHVVRHHDRRWAIFSPEMGEWEEFCSRVISWLTRTPFGRLSDEDVANTAEWCRSRFAFISRDSGDDAPTLEWLIDTWRVCVMRDGVTDVLLDPWNQVQHQRAGQSETEYIDQALLKLAAFGRRHGVNVWIVAHPTKMRPAKAGDPLPVPTLYDISGSAGWANKTDVGMSVYRTGGYTQAHILKAKFDRWNIGGAGDVSKPVFAEMEYEIGTGWFVAPGYANGQPPDDAPYDQPPEF